jgi:hypothetical protein
MHNKITKRANKSSKNMEKFKYWGMAQIKIACLKKLRAEYIQEIPAQFSPESFVFQFVTQKYTV